MQKMMKFIIFLNFFMIFRGYIPGRFGQEIAKLSLKIDDFHHFWLKIAQIWSNKAENSLKFMSLALNWWNLDIKKRHFFMKKWCFLIYFHPLFSFIFMKFWRIIWNLNLKKHQKITKKWCFLHILSIYFHLFSWIISWNSSFYEE